MLYKGDISMGLAEVLKKFPNHINYGDRAAIFYGGFFIGHVHQDRTKCIYEAVLRDGKINMKFLSNFKYKKLLSTNLWGNRLNLFVLQEMLDE